MPAYLERAVFVFEFKLLVLLELRLPPRLYLSCQRVHVGMGPGRQRDRIALDRRHSPPPWL